MKNKYAPTLFGILIVSSLLIFLIISTPRGTSDTPVGQTHITSDTIWNTSASPYFIEGNVTVDPGITLTIEPGVEVRFNGFYCIYIEGNLLAVGNESDMIVFTSNQSSPAERDWDTIQINSTGSAEIAYCSITYGNFGISVRESAGNMIENNFISENYIGVFLESTQDNLIQSNNIMNNSWNGLNLFSNSDANIIWENTISGNFRGINLYFADGNEIRYNTIVDNNGHGIDLGFSDSNEITNNNISENDAPGYYGIKIESSQDNVIYHNTFINNAIQASDDDTTNIWDNGYPSGGNYWSDYTGEDIKRGENQDVPGSDGIGDTNYSIDGDTYDRFPLMNITRNIAPYLISLTSPANNSIISTTVIIDLDILAEDVDHVEYSLNSAANQILPPPYNISTASWAEGDNRLDVYVYDSGGNVSSDWFSFHVDTTPPMITLISPQNNSIIMSGDTIDIQITDPNLISAEYFLNDILQGEFMFPHDINTTLWDDGQYEVKVTAEDIAGNTNSTTFVFAMDDTPPVIVLLNPPNGSYNAPGVMINFTVLDDHDFTVNYSIDGGTVQTFDPPYLINTSTLSHGTHEISVQARDIKGNYNFQSFNFFLDFEEPKVVLISPQNNSLIRQGTPLNFSVSDDSPVTFMYALVSDNYKPVYEPFDINTSTFLEGRYDIKILVTDRAGNFNLSSYNITIDMIKPLIHLDSHQNLSAFPPGTVLEFSIVENHPAFTNYTMDGGEPQVMPASNRLDTSGWSDGFHEIRIFSIDAVGNNNSALFVFRIDSIPPYVTSSTPVDGSDKVPVGSSIRIKFSEPMDRLIIDFGISINPAINFTTEWGADNLTLIIIPLENLTKDTTYDIRINTTATDEAGNHLSSSYEFSFRTGERQGIDFIWIFILIIIAIAVISGLLLIFEKRRRSVKSVDEEEDEFDLDNIKSREEEGPEGGDITGEEEKKD